jgi:twinkle protein
MQKIIDDDLLAFMGEQESQFLIQPSTLMDQVKSRILDDEKIRGDALPWNKTHRFVRLRPGEVSLWAGINGHGKSNILGQVCAWGLTRNWLLASMEMLPDATMERMIKQISGTAKPANSFIEKILTWTDDKLWLYDQTDSVASERILALVRYAVAKNIHHVVIDSLMKCGIRKDDLEKQTYFIDKLCWLAKKNKIHIHVVHHIRKGESEYKIPGKFDIRGAGEVTDLVDNVFIIHRNKQKEETKNTDPQEPDCWLKIAKQRHFSFEGNFKLWFNPESGQYTGEPNRTLCHWINR